MPLSRAGCNAWVVSYAQDFRTGYYTLASPKALFTVQVCGAFLGVLYSPAVYTFYNHAFKSAPPVVKPPPVRCWARCYHCSICAVHTVSNWRLYCMVNLLKRSCMPSCMSVHAAGSKARPCQP